MGRERDVMTAYDPLVDAIGLLEVSIVLMPNPPSSEQSRAIETLEHAAYYLIRSVKQ